MNERVANDLTRPHQIRHQLTEQLDATNAPRLAAAIEVYSTRDGDQRFRRSLQWLLDGLLADPP